MRGASVSPDRVAPAAGGTLRALLAPFGLDSPFDEAQGRSSAEVQGGPQ